MSFLCFLAMTISQARHSFFSYDIITIQIYIIRVIIYTARVNLKNDEPRSLPIRITVSTVYCYCCYCCGCRRHSEQF